MVHALSIDCGNCGYEYWKPKDEQIKELNMNHYIIKLKTIKVFIVKGTGVADALEYFVNNTDYVFGDVISIALIEDSMIEIT